MKRAFAFVLLCSCASVRYIDQPVVWNEGDARPVKAPKKRSLSIHWSAIRDIIVLPIDRIFDFDYGVEAENANALDEVADSTWWKDPRRGVREHGYRPLAFTREQVRVGPNTSTDMPVLPLTVWKTKAVGSTPGFAAKDARGVQYLVKIDSPGPVGLATATEIVSERIAWACGWLVPSLMLFDVNDEDLKWAPKVSFRDHSDAKVSYTKEMHQKMLERAPRIDGKIRILVSRWLDGEPIGPFAYAGREHGDANDKLKHENRRDLRAFSIFTAWVNDVDTLQNNTLDMYEGEPGKGHVVHWQQDVGGAFGVWAALDMPYWMGQEGYFLFSHVLASIATLGVYSAPWQHDDYVNRLAVRTALWPELGGFDAQTFEPKRWHSAASNPAFDRLTARDGYWGAKRILAMSADEVWGAIDAGLYAPSVAQRLFDVLWERRRRILDAYFRGVAALDYFVLDEQKLCFDDLFYEAKLDGASHYRASEEQRARMIEWSGSHGCVAIAAAKGYRVIQLGVRRDTAGEKRVRVHFIDDASGPRIIGIER